MMCLNKTDVLILVFIYFCFLKICFEWFKELFWVCEVKLYIISLRFKCKKHNTQNSQRRQMCPILIYILDQ
jgi:hypothetical protein